MNKKLIFVIFILILSLETREGTLIADENKNIKNKDFRKKQKEFNNIGFLYGNETEEIKNNLGIPNETRIIDFNNLHNKNQKDKIYELIYDGLYVKIYKDSLNNSEKIMQITITSKKYKVKWDLNIGEEKEKIIEKFGDPNEDKDNVLYYIGEVAAPIGFQFYLKDNKIIKINWNKFID